MWADFAHKQSRWLQSSSRLEVPARPRHQVHFLKSNLLYSTSAEPIDRSTLTPASSSTSSSRYSLQAGGNSCPYRARLPSLPQSQWRSYPLEQNCIHCLMFLMEHPPGSCAMTVPNISSSSLHCAGTPQIMFTTQKKMSLYTVVSSIRMPVPRFNKSGSRRIDRKPSHSRRSSTLYSISSGKILSYECDTDSTGPSPQTRSILFADWGSWAREHIREVNPCEWPTQLSLYFPLCSRTYSMMAGTSYLASSSKEKSQNLGSSTSKV